jgi:hypothetical protein
MGRRISNYSTAKSPTVGSPVCRRHLTGQTQYDATTLSKPLALKRGRRGTLPYMPYRSPVRRLSVTTRLAVSRRRTLGLADPQTAGAPYVYDRSRLERRLLLSATRSITECIHLYWPFSPIQRPRAPDCYSLHRVRGRIGRNRSRPTASAATRVVGRVSNHPTGAGRSGPFLSANPGL